MVLTLAILSPALPMRAATAGVEIGKQLEAAAGVGGANLGEPIDPRVTVVLIIRFVLNLTGLILLGLVVYAGIMWMTAGGNEEHITKAKGLLKNAIIGLIIVVSSYAITIFAANLARGYTNAIPYHY